MKKIFKKIVTTSFVLGVLTIYTSGVKAQSATITGPTFGCNNPGLVINVAITGLTGPYTYSWSNGSTYSNQTLHFPAFLRVDVTGTNASGSQQTARSPYKLVIVLPNPIAGITPVGSTALCPGETAVLNASGGGPFGTYLWSTGSSNFSITVNAAGTYTVTVSNILGCSSTASQVITAASATANLNITGSTTLCPGDSTLLEAVGGTNTSTYSWSNGESTTSIYATQTGNYYVTITTGNCSATSDTVHIEVFSQGFAPAITASGPITFCQPGCVTLSAPPGFSSYTWTTGGINPTTNSSQSFNFCLFGTGAGSQLLDTSTVSLTVGVNNGQCNFNAKPIVCRSVREPELLGTFPQLNHNLSDTLTAGIILLYLNFYPEYEFEFEETTNPGVTWIYNNGTSRKLALSNVPNLAIGKYYNIRERGRVNGVSYCFGDPRQIGITGAIAPQNGNSRILNSGSELVEVNVFPNPSNSEFNVNIASVNEQLKTITVRDISGRLLESNSFSTFNNFMTVGSDLAPGVYFIEVTQGSDYNNVTRIVKTN